MWAGLVGGGSTTSYNDNVIGQQCPVLTKHLINAREIMPSQMPGLLLVVLPFLNHAIDLSNETLYLAHCSLSMDHSTGPWHHLKIP